MSHKCVRRGNNSERSRGVVLMIILGVLVLLAVLATTFLTMAVTEKSVSHNFSDEVRAKHMAQSGIEFAISKIKANPSSKSVMYWGDNLPENGAPTTAPIEWCKNPSFAEETDFNTTTGEGDAENVSVNPRQINVFNPTTNAVQQIGISGHSPGSYGTYCDVYTLKVTDLSGRIYVNDGLYMNGGNNSTVSQNLKRILNRMGKLPSVNVANLGDLIITNRPATGYSNKFELIKAIGSVVFQKVEPFITTYGWVDKNVVNPVPIGFSVEGQYPVQYWRQAASGFPSSQAPVYGNKTFRRELGTIGTGSYLASNGSPYWLSAPMQWYNPSNTWQGHNSIYTLDELFPQYVEVVWRAPVNVNAAPKEVIMALTSGLSGVFWVERRQATPHYPSPASFNYSGPGFGGSPISFTEPQNYYTWQFLGMTMDSQGSGGDEYGHLYKTVDILMPGETGTLGSLDAGQIADHFIGCRSKSTVGSVNYNGKWYSGMFRNWAQFNAFCDGLVESGVLADNRGNGNATWYWDYTGSGSSLPGMSKPYSAGQAKRAAYAIADTLKANFNPNCHLNETNPDANLFTLVDKTDLVANSTEFCFWPTGYFEVESLGRILRPTESTGGTGTPVDIFSSQQLRIVAEKKILVIMKMFDLYRETSQRHFQHGQVYPKMSGTETNSNRGMEVGPEVNNGPFPYGDTFNGYSYATYAAKDGFAQYPTASTQINSGWNMEYDGYIQLTTIGGCNIDMPARPGTGTPGGQASGTMQTPAGSPHFLANQLGSYEGMHSHFQFDFRNHYNRSAQTHGDSFRDDLGAVVRAANSYIDQGQYSKPPKIERAANFPDSPADGFAGPYCTAYSPNFRIARGFRLPLQMSSGTEPIPMPYLRPIAPSDLRIDGAYSEFRSGVAYWVDEGYAINSWGFAASFWFKPSFYPEHAGRMRKIIGYGNWHAKNYSWQNPHGMDLYLAPSHFGATYQMEPYETYASQYQGNAYSAGNDAPPPATGGYGFAWCRPASLWCISNGNCYDGAGLADWNDEGPWVEYENYANTPPLNHNLHPNGLDALSKWRSASSAGEKPNYMEGNRWTHIMWAYSCPQHGASFSYTNVNWFKILVNGQELADTRSDAYGHKCNSGNVFTSGGKYPVFSIQSFSDGSTGKWRTNTFRLGDMCYHGFTANFQGFGSNTQLWPKNLTSDGTFDEFFIWRSGNITDSNARSNDVNYILNNGKQQWAFGRYYKPLNYSGSFPTDAVFESGKIFLTAVSQPVRSLPPLSNVLPPNGETGTTTTISFTASAKKIRVLGVAWTSLEEDYARDTGKPLMYDWNVIPFFDSVQGKFIGNKMVQQDPSGKAMPCSRLWVQIYDGTGAKKLLFPKVTNQYGAPNTGFIDDYYSKLYNDATSQWYYELDTGETFTYVVGLKIEGLQNSTVLRATPVFDDVTFFYSQGDLEILMYIPINITG